MGTGSWSGLRRIISVIILRENFNKIVNYTRQYSMIGWTALGNAYIEQSDASVPISRLLEFLKALDDVMCIRRRYHVRYLWKPLTLITGGMQQRQIC